MATEYGERRLNRKKKLPGTSRTAFASTHGGTQDHKAALSTNNMITAASVTEYLKKRVPELALIAKLKQKPEIPSVPI